MMKFFHNPASAFAVFLILFLTGCKNNQHDVNISDIDVKLHILRFEEDLFENRINDFAGFSGKYPAFISDYTIGILGFPGNDTAAFAQLMLFKTDPNGKKMYQLVKEKFHDFSKYEEELEKAYKYFTFHFPNVKIPDIITYTSNFSFYMNPVGENYIGIALDMHMGQDFVPYKYTDIENYWKKILIPESIVTNHMMAHANDLFSGSNAGNNFIDEMIYEGRLLYFLDATTPWVEDHVKIGMTKVELDWCKKEEHNIWAFFVKDRYLYETDSRRFDRLLKDGPRTIAENVPPDAPAKIARFSGWMAVRQYMEDNKDVSLSDLMKDRNAKDILQKSGYKP
jgi:hypothetical protein